MQLDNVVISSDNQEYFSDALDVVKIKFSKFFLFKIILILYKNINLLYLVDLMDNIENKVGYEPEYAHQHFGEA